MQDFQRLDVWHAAMDLAEATYRSTNALPAAERYGLTAQMRRTAVSIPSNIAEGCGRRTRGEMLQFLGIAQGSAHELRTQSMLCRRLGYLGDDDILWELIERTSGMLLRFVGAVERERPAL